MYAGAPPRSAPFRAVGRFPLSASEWAYSVADLLATPNVFEGMPVYVAHNAADDRTGYWYSLKPLALCFAGDGTTPATLVNWGTLFAHWKKEATGGGDGTSEPGPPGLSAYEVALANGYTGTEAQWLASLVGPKGDDAYQVAVAAGYPGTREQWLTSLIGASGKSAYQSAVDGGFTGTEANWVASLEGDAGADAYQVALQNGFVGTPEQWLASLEGSNGKSAYQAAVDNGFVGTEIQWLASLEGGDGLSAYQVALAGGFVGTETEWLASLKGDQGENGETGITTTKMYRFEGADLAGGTESDGLITKVLVLPDTMPLPLAGGGHWVTSDMGPVANGTSDGTRSFAVRWKAGATWVDVMYHTNLNMLPPNDGGVAVQAGSGLTMAGGVIEVGGDITKDSSLALKDKTLTIQDSTAGKPPLSLQLNRPGNNVAFYAGASDFTASAETTGQGGSATFRAGTGVSGNLDHASFRAGFSFLAPYSRMSVSYGGNTYTLELRSNGKLYLNNVEITGGGSNLFVNYPARQVSTTYQQYNLVRFRGLLLQAREAVTTGADAASLALAEVGKWKIASQFFSRLNTVGTAGGGTHTPFFWEEVTMVDGFINTANTVIRLTPAVGSRIMAGMKLIIQVIINAAGGVLEVAQTEDEGSEIAIPLRPYAGLQFIEHIELQAFEDGLWSVVSGGGTVSAAQILATPVTGYNPTLVGEIENGDPLVDVLSRHGRMIEEGTGKLNLTEVDTPLAPASGAVVFGQKRAGRVHASQIGPSGLAYNFQAALFQNKVRTWTVKEGTTTQQNYNFNYIGYGTATTRGVSSASRYQAMGRLGQASGTGANAVAGFRWASGAGALAFCGMVGYLYVARFGIAAVSANMKGAIGFTSVFGNALSTQAIKTNMFNFVGVAFDSDQKTFHFTHSNETPSTNTTQVSCGVGFPANTASADMYELRVYCHPGGARVGMSLENLTTGAVAEYVATTNIPAPGVLLAPQGNICNVSDAVDVQIDFVQQYIETDY